MRLLGWCLQITNGNRAEAEDLVHDAYVQFVRAAPPLKTIQNVDAYLNRMVRNLYLSRLATRNRNPLQTLDASEYDSIAICLQAEDLSSIAGMRSQLTRICDWACRRRPETKAASVLTLRFFLGYLPSEIARMLPGGREAVEKHLQLARRELTVSATADADYTEVPSENGSVLQMHHREDAAEVFRLPFVSGDDFTAWLHQRIFSDRVGPCLTMLEIDQTNACFSNRLHLAHITSCPVCLNKVSRHLKISGFEERWTERNGGDPGRPPSSGGGGSSESPNAIIGRAKRTIQATFEHRPKQLRLHVDGDRRAAIKVQSGEVDCSFELSRSNSVEFVEVFSEQNVRLLYLCIDSIHQGGEYRQTAELALSDNRRLRLQFSWSQPRPKVELRYTDPLFHCFAPSGWTNDFPAEPAMIVLRPRESWPALARAFVAWVSLCSWPDGLRLVAATVLILALPMMEMREGWLSAATIIAGAVRWERSATPDSLVLHRSFSYVERQQGRNGAVGEVRRGRVEVWRQRTAGIQALEFYDPQGHLQSRAVTPLSESLAPDQPWQWVPSAELLSSVPDGGATSLVIPESGRVRVHTPSVDVLFDRASLKPIGAYLRLNGREIELSELLTEALPMAATPLVDALRPKALPARAPEAIPPAVFTDAKRVSIEVSETLHRLQADLGEEILVTLAGNRVRISGVVDSVARRDQIARALQRIEGVDVRLLTPSEVPVRATPERIQDAGSPPLMRPPLLIERLQALYPSKEQQSAEVQHLLGMADQCLWRAQAIRKLHAQYGGDPDPRILAIAAEHLRAMSAAARELHGWLSALDLAAEDGETASLGYGDAERIVSIASDLNAEMASLLAVHASGSDGASTTVERALTNSRQLRQLSNLASQQ